MPNEILHPIQVTVVAPSGLRSERKIDFSYSDASPFTIKIDFGNGDKGCWFVSRDLLAGGLMGGQTEGRVSIQPDLADEQAVVIHFSDRSGTWAVSALFIELDDFLLGTYDIVPLGEEQETAFDAFYDFLDAS